MTTREKARQLTIQVNNQMNTYKQNKKAGLKHSFEYLRWLKSLMIERDRMWELSEAK